MGSVVLTVRLDLEAYSINTDYSSSVVRDHVVRALKQLFGEVGAAFPFEVDCVDKKSREIQIITDEIFRQKISCALTLLDKYQGINCCFSTLQTVKQTESS